MNPHSINLDVSRALDAQRSLLKGFDDGCAGNRITVGMDPAKKQIDSIGTSINNVKNALGSISSARLDKQITNFKAIYDQLEKIQRMNFHGFGNIPDSAFKNIITGAKESTVQANFLIDAFNKLASQLKGCPSTSLIILQLKITGKISSSWGRITDFECVQSPYEPH